MSIYYDTDDSLESLIYKHFQVWPSPDGVGLFLLYAPGPAVTRNNWGAIRDEVDKYYASHDESHVRYLSDQLYQHHLDEMTKWSSNSPTKTMVNAGHVYLVRADTGDFKIGKTKSLVGRLKAMQTGSPYKLELVHSIATDNMSELEAELHFQFSAKRSEGEWFQLSQEDVDYLKGL